MATGFITGAVCLIPLIVVIVLLRQKVVLRQEGATLLVRIGRRDHAIVRRDIHRIVVHEPALGPIRLYSTEGALLLSVNPPVQEYARVVGFLTDGHSYSAVSRQPVFGGRLTAITFMDGAQR